MFYTPHRRSTSSSFPHDQHKRRRNQVLRAAVETLEGRQLLSASDLDTGFGETGAVVGTFGDTSQFNDVVLLPDGKILAVGVSGTAIPQGVDTPPFANDFLVARYNADGTLDTTFGGGDGFVLTDFAPDNVTDVAGYEDAANAVALLPDGDFVVVGSSRLGFRGDIAVARYNADGTLDTSFSGDGKVLTEVTGVQAGVPINSIANAIVVTPAGKILVAGSSNSFYDMSEEAGSRFTLVRYNANGTLDGTFGTAGVSNPQFIYFQLELPDGTLADIPSAMYASDVALLPNGKIIVGGTADVAYDYGISQNSFALARYNANGSLDSTFGKGGWATGIEGNGEGGDLVIRPDGSIVMTGSRSLSFDQNVAAARYTSAGVRDRSFGTDSSGFVEVPFVAENEDPDTEVSSSVARTVLALPNGQLLLIGGVDPVFSSDPGQLVVTRLNANGQLDTSYGTGGKLRADVLSEGRAAVLQPDGKVVVVGAVPVEGGNLQAGLIRFDTLGTASVSGKIYNDANQNGAADDGETPLVGWTAYVDYNNNGKVDESEPFAVTDADGAYQITGLAAGTYRIREIRQSGWTRSEPPGNFPLGYYDLTLTDGQAQTGSDFGNYEPPVGVPVPPPAPPTGTADTSTTTQDRPAVTDVLSNDTADDDLDPGSVTIVTEPSNGKAVVNPVTGAITYLPNAGFSGTDTYAYTVANANGDASDPIDVTVQVEAAQLGGTAESTLPSTAIGGEKAKGRVAVGVTNQASEQVRGKTVLTVFLSDDEVLDDGDAEVTSVERNLKLKAGQTKNVNVKIRSFPRVGANTFQVLTRVTSPDGSVAVIPSGTITLTDPFVNLTPTVVTQPATTLPRGGQGRMTIEIANEGNVFARGETEIDIYASADGTLSDGDIDVLIETISTRLNIKPGGSVRRVIRFDVPGDLAISPAIFIARVNPDGQIVERDLQDNNAVTSTVTLS